MRKRRVVPLGLFAILLVFLTACSDDSPEVGSLAYAEQEVRKEF
ncbi:hypothetical protein [Saccharibacillus alkalitolerans]|nr:hypothetical protein [Saccharibacillus alkalitolerans]